MKYNKAFHIDRLVAEAFVPKTRTNQWFLGHINGIYADNRAVNLFWSPNKISKTVNRQSAIKSQLELLRDTTDKDEINRIVTDIDTINQS